MNAASILKELSAAVADSKSEQSQVNGVVRVLSALGYKGAGSPEVHQTTVDRSTFRVYLWRDSPFGDHLILATGPSFVPKLALASDVPAEPGVGVYVRALVSKDARTLAGAGRMAERAASSHAAAEDRSARSRARESTRQDETLARRGAAERDRAEAERAERDRKEAEHVARAHTSSEEARLRAKALGHAEREREREAHMARKGEERRLAAEAAEAASRKAAAPDTNKAMAQAQALIAMLKAQKSA